MNLMSPSIDTSFRNRFRRKRTGTFRLSDGPSGEVGEIVAIERGFYHSRKPKNGIIFDSEITEIQWDIILRRVKMFDFIHQ
jgi:hypothetical protein